MTNITLPKILRTNQLPCKSCKVCETCYYDAQIQKMVEALTQLYDLPHEPNDLSEYSEPYHVLIVDNEGELSVLIDVKHLLEALK